MSVQDMISDIQNHLNQLSSDALTVIWQLVQLLDAPNAGPRLFAQSSSSWPFVVLNFKCVHPIDHHISSCIIN